MKRYGVFLFAMAVLMSGCSSQPGAWLKGKWVFDKEYSEKKWEAESKATVEKLNKEEDGGGLVGAFAEFGKGLFSPLLLAALEGMEIQFNDGEMITTKDGTGEAKKYEVLETPDSSTVVIKTAKGEVKTLKLEDGRLVVPGDGNANFVAYFRRAN